MRSEAYFGLQRGDGSEINDAQWRQFLAEVVTPRLPDGLTVVNADGQWLDGTGTVIREPARLLIVIDSTPRAADTLDEVARLWCERFDQQSVLRVDGPARFEFVGREPR